MAAGRFAVILQFNTRFAIIHKNKVKFINKRWKNIKQ